MSVTQQPPDSRRNWFDGTINIPTVLSIISAAVVVSVFAVGLYNGIDRRVLQLEGAHGEVEKHFARIEQDQQRLRDDVKEQLRGISSDVKDTNQKLDQLLYNRAGARPETKGWTR